MLVTLVYRNNEQFNKVNNMKGVYVVAAAAQLGDTDTQFFLTSQQ